MNAAHLQQHSFATLAGFAYTFLGLQVHHIPLKKGALQHRAAGTLRGGAGCLVKARQSRPDTRTSSSPVEKRRPCIVVLSHCTSSPMCGKARKQSSERYMFSVHVCFVVEPTRTHSTLPSVAVTAQVELPRRAFFCYRLSIA